VGIQLAPSEVCGNLGDWYNFETNVAKGLETIDQMPNLAPALASAFPGREQLEIVLGATRFEC